MSEESPFKPHVAVWVSVAGYGQSGPWRRDKVLTVNRRTGNFSVTNDPNMWFRPSRTAGGYSGDAIQAGETHGRWRRVKISTPETDAMVEKENVLPLRRNRIRDIEYRLGRITPEMALEESLTFIERALDRMEEFAADGDDVQA